MASCILFFSNKCESSRVLMSYIHKNNLTYIKKYNVDEMDKNKLKLSGITNVPTIVIKSEDGIKLYECDKAFLWIKNAISQNKTPNDDIVCFTIEEMTGIRDNYAYLNLDIPQPKSFMPYDQESYKINIYADDGKITKHTFVNLLKDFEKNRNQDITDAINSNNELYNKIKNDIK